jgi:peroxisomal 2,4-dienoyl-CoA reductase
VLKSVKEALDKFGSIDILINAAAGNFLCPVSSMSSNAFKTVLDIDTIGTFNCSKAVFDSYMKDHGGCIINISATLYFCGTPMQAHAGAAKAAVGNARNTTHACI